MFGKYSNKKLIIVLGILVGLYLMSWVMSGSKHSSFKKDLVVLDTALVDQLIIHPAKAAGEKVELKKDAAGWKVITADGSDFAVSDEIMVASLGQITQLTASQVVADKESDWVEYQVDEAGGTKLEVMAAGKTLAHIVLGKFEYKQTGMMSYIRPIDDDKVYLVDGFLDMAFNKAAQDWRDKSLVKNSTTDWISLTFSYPDSSFQIYKDMNSQWQLSDSSVTDAAKVDAYFQAFSKLSGTNFIDYTPKSTARMKVEATTSTGDPVSISAYPITDSTFAITSSDNAVFFDGGGLVGNIFKQIRDFQK